jgi:[ribosomal protein S18]-alanine N-acetyltransferase
MPLRELRRLEAPTGSSLHARLSREALSYAWSPSEVDPIPGELIVEREGNVLAAFGGAAQARLAYSFASDSEFVDLFPPMFEVLLPRIKKLLDAETVRFRLGHGSSRMAVEPVLKKLSFTPKRPWLTFSLEKRDAPAKSAAPKGVTFRRGAASDVEAVVRIDRDAFPDTPMPEAAYRHHLDRGDELMLASVGSEIAGFALYSHDGTDEGYLSSLAVAEAYRGRGIGPALTVRVAKWAFAQGATHLALRTEEDNRTAIGVYRALGFKHVGSGNDYERPTDPRVIAALKKAGEGTLIRFGGWR